MSEEIFCLHSSLFTHNKSLFVFFVQLVATAATTKFFEFKPVGRVLFIFGRHVITLFALCALQNNIISWHKSSFV